MSDEKKPDENSSTASCAFQLRFYCTSLYTAALPEFHLIYFTKKYMFYNVKVLVTLLVFIQLL